jgi:oxygen-independent coproporphyrinogen-3 oxidase
MSYSIYLHVPFCKRRCHYCDFNTYAGKETLLPAYINSLIEEIRIVNRENQGLPVHSIYFGGGTPSIVPINLFQNVFNILQKEFSLAGDCEISLEANPGTLNLDYLKDLKDVGFNRISIGAQSMIESDLARLDRIHVIKDIIESVKYSRKAGFTNINLDLIFGLPWQDLQRWKHVLSKALELQPEHFSIYSLIIEPGTMLYRWYQKGKIALQNQDVEAEMYEFTMDKLESHNYSHYEISNWAKSDVSLDYRCRHNLQYWLNQSYLGIGAGAHGYANGLRTVNAKRINDYINRIKNHQFTNLKFPQSPANIIIKKVKQQEQMNDFMMLGLRLIEEGVSDTRFHRDFGVSMQNVFNEEIQDLLDKGLVKWVGQNKDRLVLTKKAIPVANQAFMNFV